MSSPSGPGEQPYSGGQSQGSSGPGRSADPYAAGPAGYPGGGQQAYPGQAYPGQQGQGQQSYPPQGGYPGSQQGYPGQYAAAPGQYPAAPGGYPGYPGKAELPPAPTRPNTVDLAFWCWMVTAALALFGVFLSLMSPTWDQALEAAGGDSNAQNIVTTAKIIAVVAAVIFVAVYALFAFKMRAGRNWARIVLTIFGALSLLTTFGTTTRTVVVNGRTFEVASTAWLGYLSALVALAGIVLMFLPASNKFFADYRARKLAALR